MQNKARTSLEPKCVRLGTVKLPRSDPRLNHAAAPKKESPTGCQRGLHPGNPPLVFGQSLVEAWLGGGVAGDIVRGVDVELHTAVG